MIIYLLILFIIFIVFRCIAEIEIRRTKGKLYWHIHHDQLLEMAKEPIARRRKYIVRWKPSKEIGTRLRCLQPVKGTLPSEVVEAFRVSARANKKLSGMWVDGSLPMSDKLLEKLDNKCVRATVRLRETLQKYESEINRLHTEECSCPWNGTTLFPGG